jgi:glycosyltransferase involved in cell wall biosynthesis
MSMPSKIKLLKIISGFGVESPLGGIEKFVISLCQAMDKSKIDVQVCGLWDFDSEFESNWRNELEEDGINTYIGAKWNPHKPYLSFIQSLQKMKRYKNNLNSEIVHSHGQFCDIAALYLFRRKNTLLARTVHEDKEWRKRQFRRLIFTNLLFPISFDIEIGVSQNITKNLQSRPITSLLGRNAYQINNSINPSRFKHVSIDIPSKKRDLGLPTNKFIIGSIGRLTKQKGYSYLLQSVKITSQTSTNFHCLIIGDGEERTALDNEINNLKISEFVTFLGPRQDIPELYPLMDLFVSPSLWEGLPTVILESMAAGIPILATDIPGTRELITHKQNGWLVPAKSPKLMSQAILSLINNPRLRRNLVQSANKKIPAFSITTVAQEYLSLYERVRSKH